jgi:hypothetical protein
MLESDKRARIPGEEGLWHYKRATARVLLKRLPEAREDLAVALKPDSVIWVQGRAHLETARIAMQQGDQATARWEAARAISACEAGNDPTCVEDARRIK